MADSENTATSESRAARELREIFESGRPLVYVKSAEEERVGRLLRAAAESVFPESIPVWTWSLTEGMRPAGGEGEVQILGPRAALDFIAKFDEPGSENRRRFALRARFPRFIAASYRKSHVT